MPNTLTSYFRTQFPQDSRTDDEITMLYATEHGVETLAQFPDALADYKRIEVQMRKAFAPPLRTEFSRGFGSGVDQVQSKLYDTAALAGEVIGSEGLKQWGDEGYKRNVAEAAQNAPTIQSVGEIESIPDALRYGVGLAGQQTPNILATAGGAVVGGLTGGVPGAIAGAGAVGFSQMQNRGELRSTPGAENVVPTALGVGSIGAILEAIVPLKITNKFLKGVSDDVAKAYYARALKEVPINALEEGGTEVLQEITSIAGELFAHRNNPNFQLDSDAIKNRLINAGVAGSILGGGAGAAGAIPGPRQSNETTIEPQVSSPQSRIAPTPQPTDPFQAQLNPRVAAARESVLSALIPDEDDLLGERVEPLRAPYQTPVRLSLLPTVLTEPVAAVTEPPLAPQSVDSVNPPVPSAVPELPGTLEPLPIAVPAVPSPIAEQVTAAAAETDVAPTDAQKESGNYRKGRVTVHGLEIAIENPAGSERSGVDADGNRWSVVMPTHYGYFAGTRANDGDAVDVYVGPNPELENVYVIDQVKLDKKRRTFDEVKTFIGFPTREAAIQAYDAAFSDGKGPERRSEVTATTISDFKTWLEKGNKREPFATSGFAAVDAEPSETEAATKPLDLESVDFDNGALTKLKTSRGTASKRLVGEDEAEQDLGIIERNVEPPFFTVSETEFSPELAERLVSDATAQNAKSKSLTRRVAFFEDQETGEVVGLPVWKRTSTQYGSIFYVTDPFRSGVKNSRLDDFMESGRFVPVASARLLSDVSGTQKAIVARYSDYADFETRFVEPARERLKTVSGYEGHVRAKMQAQGFDFQGDILERYSEDNQVQDDPAQILRDGIVEELGKSSDLTINGVAKAVRRLAADPDYQAGYIYAAREILKDPEFRALMHGRTAEQQQSALADKLAEKIYGRVKELQVVATGVGAGGAGIDLGGDLFSRREGQYPRASKAQIRAHFQSIVEAAQEAGITVEFTEAIGKEVGSFRGKQRKVTLALFDALNPSADNIRLLIHEVGHDVVRQLPEEVRTLALEGIRNYTDEQLRLLSSPDARIREGNPAGLSEKVLDEERLVEHLALKIGDQNQARTLGAEIIRFIKALYYRIAMATQKLFGRNPNPELALAFTQQLLETTIAGERIGLFHFLIPPGSRDFPDYDLYSKPQFGERVAPEVIANTKIAAWNEQLDFESRVILPALKQVPEALNASEEAGYSSVLEWHRRISRIPDAAALIQTEDQRAFAQGVAVDVRTRFADLKSEQNRDRAAKESYIQRQRIYARLENRLSKLEREVPEMEAEHLAANTELSAIASNYSDVENLNRIIERETKAGINRLLKDLAGASQELGVVEQQLIALGETKEAVRLFAPAFRKLFTGDQLKGEKLYPFLEAMAVHPDIDFQLPIREIRESLKLSGDVRFTRLLQDEKESKALLAALVGYAKTNNKLLLAIELRKLTDIPKRQKIDQQVRDLLLKGKSVAKDLPKLRKRAELETRLRVELEREKSAALSRHRQLKRAEAERAALRGVIGLYRRWMMEGAGPNRIHAPFVFGHGAEYWVPNSPGATLGNGMTQKRISLATAGDYAGQIPISQRSELAADITKMSEWLESQTEQNGEYWAIKAMRDELSANGVIRPAVQVSDHALTELMFSDIGTQAGSLGTPAATKIKELISKFATSSSQFRNKLLPLVVNAERARSEAAKLLGISEEHYKLHFYDFAASFVERNRDIAERHPGNLKKQLDEAIPGLLRALLRNPAAAVVLERKEQSAMAAIRKHIEAEWAVSHKIDQDLEVHGVGTRDEAIKVEVSKGVFTAGERKRMNVGIMTLPRVTSQTFTDLFEAMKDTWVEAPYAFKHAAEIYTQFGPVELDRIVQPYFTDPLVQQHFFGALANMDTVSPFPAPVFEDGVTQPEAFPPYVHEAWDKSRGNVLKFAELLYELHGGSTDQGVYVQQVLNTFARYWNEIRRTQEDINPDRAGIPLDSFRSMIPGLMVNARKSEHWPTAWFQYMAFDRARLNHLSERLAAEVSFGINNERLESAYLTMANEVAAAEQKLRAAMNSVQNSYSGKNQTEVEKLLEKAVGGAIELKRLRKIVERKPLLVGENGIRRQLADFFRGKNGSTKPARFARRLVSLFVTLMLNQPGSALMQFADTFAPLFSGVSGSSIRQALETLGATAGDIGGSLAQAIGFQLSKQDSLRVRLNRLTGGDSDAVLKLSDILRRDDSPYRQGSVMDSASQAASILRELPSLTVGRSGQSTGLRPFAPFNQVTKALHTGAAIGQVRIVEDYVTRGMTWAQSHPLTSDLADWNFEQWAAALRLPLAEEGTFVRVMTKARNEFGLDFFHLIRDGIRNHQSGRDVLDDRTVALLAGMATNEITLEGNIATMPTQAFTSSTLRTILPLFGWPIRQMMRVADLRRDAEGRYSHAAVAKGLLALAAMAGGGLAISALADLYNEELLGKKRNLRRLSLDQDPGSLAYAILEHSARVGTFGLAGDLLNEMVNIGTGEGANRGLSADHRIVVVNSALGLMRSISTLVNQRFDADYAGVVRPAMFALGGNGPLHYLQLVSNLTDLDSGESRMVTRTNVRNWLRVVGREIGLEVRNSQGGFATPTPLTPHITRMELAALAEDHEAFQKAYRDAVEVEKKRGKPDPAKAVSESFSARHPLRTVYRSTPTEQQYRQILSTLPESGRVDVIEAVRAFNQFGAKIGVKPFDGKSEPVPAALTPWELQERISRIRQRATFF